MATGTVKWFNDAKGFGFIEPDGGGSDIFAHFSAITMEGFKTLKQGSRVSFEVQQGPKGQLAQNIQAAARPDPDAARPAPSGPSASRRSARRSSMRPSGTAANTPANDVSAGALMRRRWIEQSRPRAAFGVSCLVLPPLGEGWDGGAPPAELQRRAPPPRPSPKGGGSNSNRARGSGPLRRRQRRVERRARTHDRRHLRAIRQVVAADVHRLALHRIQLGDDLLLVLGERLGQRREARGQFGVFGLRRQFLRPVQRQVELAAAVVELAGLGRRALAVVQQLAGGGVERRWPGSWPSCCRS